nr:hypothetical protein [Oscillochloris trichoides]
MNSAACIHNYRIEVLGRLDADFLAACCPPETRMVLGDTVTTLSHLRTDQAGIIGIIRHLHNCGCVLSLLIIETEVGS